MRVRRSFLIPYRWLKLTRTAHRMEGLKSTTPNHTVKLRMTLNPEKDQYMGIQTQANNPKGLGKRLNQKVKTKFQIPGKLH